MEIKNTLLYKHIKRYNELLKDDDTEHHLLLGTILIIFKLIILSIGGLFMAIFGLFIIPISLLLNILEIIFRKDDKKYLKDVNKYLLKYGESLVKKHKHYKLEENHIHYVQPNNLKDFITMFLNTYNNKLNTINKNGKKVCDKGKYRSLGDIYLICRYYFPNCSIIDVLKILYSNKNINHQRCSTINKVVFYNSYYSSFNKNNIKVEYFGSNIKLNDIMEKLK